MIGKFKSIKPVLALKDIVRPYQFVPKEDIEGGVNNVMFFYKKGGKYPLKYPQFEVLLNAGKIVIDQQLGGDFMEYETKIKKLKGGFQGVILVPKGKVVSPLLPNKQEVEKWIEEQKKAMG